MPIHILYRRTYSIFLISTEGAEKLISVVSVHGSSFTRQLLISLTFNIQPLHGGLKENNVTKSPHNYIQNSQQGSTLASACTSFICLLGSPLNAILNPALA